MGDNDDSDDLFLDAMKGVAPLGNKQRERHADEPPRAAPAKNSAPPKQAFIVSRDGDVIEGRAPGVSRRQTADLRAGREPIDAELDLHGLSLAVAEAAVRGRIAAAAREGKRCLRLIHGRGSFALRDRCITWLSSGKTAPQVRAFATTRPKHGGPGALYVLLSSRGHVPTP